jgi:CheY-like chemotaxis protein
MLSNRECDRLQISREVGADFETDQLDLFPARFRVVEVTAQGVRVVRLSWSGPEPAGLPERARPAATEPLPRATRRCRGNILIVEDDAATQQALADVLETEGFAVHCASNGKHALRLLERIARPEGIVVDLMMPVMSGWDLLAALGASSAHADIPVAVVSAVADRSPSGVRRIAKPVTLDALLGFVEGLAGDDQRDAPR